MTTKYLVIILTAITVTSCKKNNIAKNSDPSIPENVKLQKIIRVDTTKTSPNDTISVTTFLYDNSNKVLKIDEHGFSTTPGKDWFIVTSFHYNGASVLPIKATSKTTGGNTPPGVWENYDTTWFYYDAQGRILKDTVTGTAYQNGVGLPPGNTSSGYCIYKPDTVVVNSKVFVTGDVLPYQVGLDTLLYNSQGQIVKELANKGWRTNQTNAKILSRDYFTQGMLNPFSRLNVFPVFGKKSYSSSNYSMGMYLIGKRLPLDFGKYLITSVRENYIGTPSHTSDATVKYNQYDLVTEYTWFHNNPNWFGFFPYEKYKFVYSE